MQEHKYTIQEQKNYSKQWMNQGYDIHYQTVNLIKIDGIKNEYKPVQYTSDGSILEFSKNSIVGKMKSHHKNQGTTTRLITQITSYNEDLDDFKSTMSGVMHNAEVMAQDTHIQMQQNDYLVIMCCDGLDNMSKDLLDYLTTKKLLNLEILQDQGFAYFDETENKHKMVPLEQLYKEQKKFPVLNNLLHTFSTVIDDDFGIFTEKERENFKNRNLNFVLALKHCNSGKINSIRWMIDVVSSQLNPTYIQKLDTGTRPGPYSTAKLFKYMEAQPSTGGVTSEVIIETNNKKKVNQSWSTWFFTMLQYYEYKQTIAGFKTFEGWGGFLMALPGCFSIYRYEALKGEPLEKFFKLVNQEEEPTCWEANEYLVEDRLLTNILYYQKGKSYKTDFLVDAPCYTDACYDLSSYMNQRRRWSNGFIFGETNTLLNLHNILLNWNGQTHSFFQRCKMLVFMPTIVTNKIMSWINPAIYLTTIKYAIVFGVQGYFDNPEFKESHPDLYDFFTNNPNSICFSTFVSYVLFIMVLFTIIASIGAKLDRIKGYLHFVLVSFQFFSLFYIYGTFQAMRTNKLLPEDGSINIYVLLFMLSWMTLLVPFFYKPFDMLKNLKKYLIGMPFFYISYYWVYIIFHFYAYCNIDDITWGNRPSNISQGMNTFIKTQQRQEQVRQQYRATRTHILIWFLLTNFVIMYGLEIIIFSIVQNDNQDVRNICQTILNGYCYYTICNMATILILSLIHTVQGNLRPLLLSKYQPITIHKKPESKSDISFKIFRQNQENADTNDSVENSDEELI